MRILIVEDDSILQDGISVGLGMAGFTADAVSTVEDGRLATCATSYDAVVLDLMLPDGSGLDLLREWRKSGKTLPVLLLTARDQVAQRIAGLDAGADDYVGKPFDLDELAARLRAIIRRAEGRGSGEIVWGDLALDPARMRVFKGDEEVELTRREFGVLRLLMSRAGAIVEKSVLEDALYGWQEEVESNAVEVHVHHLRHKLGRQTIETVRGVGYRLAQRAVQ